MKRDSGRILPPYFWRSRLTNHVCSGTKKMNMIITLVKTNSQIVMNGLDKKKAEANAAAKFR